MLNCIFYLVLAADHRGSGFHTEIPSGDSKCAAMHAEQSWPAALLSSSKRDSCHGYAKIDKLA